MKYGLGCGIDATIPDSLLKRKEPIRKLRLGSVQNFHERDGGLRESEFWPWYSKSTFEAEVSEAVSTNNPVTVFSGINLTKTSSEYYKATFGNI